MRRARQEFNSDYVQHQRYTAEAPTSEQQRSRYPIGQSLKRAPVDFESAVSEQLAKGCPNFETAAQRVCQMYGSPVFNNRAMNTLAKGQDIESRFKKIIKRIADTENVTREEAVRLARKRNPSLFRALQSL
jgi:hypothetical protein